MTCTSVDISSLNYTKTIFYFISCYNSSRDRTETGEYRNYFFIRLLRYGTSTRSSLSMEMSGLTRDRAAEPVSPDQILRHERGQGNVNFFPVQLTTCRTSNLSRLVHSLAICVTIYTYIHTYTHSSLTCTDAVSSLYTYLKTIYSTFPRLA